VESSQALGRFVDEVPRLFQVGEVGLKDEGPAAEALDGRRHLLRRRALGTVAQRHIAALRGKLHRCRSPDPPRSAGDERTPFHRIP